MRFSTQDVAFVQRVARRMVGDTDAEDVAQEALLRAFSNRAQFAERAGLRTWLYRITINTGISHLRSRKRSRLVFDIGESRSELASPEEQVASDELRTRIRARICELQPRYRAVVALRYAADCTEGEVAAMLGISIATVKVRGFRARQQMRALMDADAAPQAAPAPWPAHIPVG
jgi:RNA polymerase sigma-70 factor (ECF subfamily)